MSLNKYHFFLFIGLILISCNFSFATDNQTLYNELNNVQITQVDVNATAYNLTKYFGDNETFHGYVNETNDYVNISIILTRLNSEATKSYDISADSNGYFELPINLAPGSYRASIVTKMVYGTPVVYDGIYDIFILNPDLNKTQTMLSYTPEIFRNGFYGKSLKGILKTESGDFLPNQTINIQITRNWNGASKTYFVKTNNLGEYELPIRLAELGSYTFFCTYEGTEFYASSNYKLTHWCNINPYEGIVSEVV